MNNELAHQIRQDPLFIRLVHKRGRYSLLLTLIMLAIYFAFILTIAFAPQVLAVPLFEGSTTTVGIPIGIAIIVIAFLLTGLYVKEANAHYDEVTKKLLEQEHILEHLNHDAS